MSSCRSDELDGDNEDDGEDDDEETGTEAKLSQVKSVARHEPLRG